MSEFQLGVAPCFLGSHRAWRLVGTGISFAVFLGGGLLLAVTASPAINLLTRSPVQRRERCHALMRGSFRAFVRMMTSPACHRSSCR